MPPRSDKPDPAALKGYANRLVAQANTSAALDKCGSIPGATCKAALPFLGLTRKSAFYACNIIIFAKHRPAPFLPPKFNGGIMFGREIEFAFFDKNKAISCPLNAVLQFAAPIMRRQAPRGSRSCTVAIVRALTQTASSAAPRARVLLARNRHTAHRRRKFLRMRTPPRQVITPKQCAATLPGSPRATALPVLALDHTLAFAHRQITA